MPGLMVGRFLRFMGFVLVFTLAVIAVFRFALDLVQRDHLGALLAVLASGFFLRASVRIAGPWLAE